MMTFRKIDCPILKIKSAGTVGDVRVCEGQSEIPE